MKNFFETIIIGAGPGGLSCGRHLDDALILEQKEEIGKPVQCAEGLTKYFLDILDIRPDPNWISATINDSQTILPNGKSAGLSAKEGGYILDRIKFEKFLAGQCRAKIQLQKRVVEIRREENLWRIKTQDGEEFQSKYLVGADGPASLVRRKIFQEEVTIYPCLQYLVELEKEVDCKTMKLYFDQERFPMGYAWFFPKSKNTANIGLGSGGKLNLQTALNDFMENTVRKELGNYRFLKNISGVIPMVREPIRLIKDNVFLVGDAGAMVDPITAGGIGNAMVAGQQAAKCILAKNIDSYPSKIGFLSCFNRGSFLAQDILYSLDNKSLNEAGEILEEKGGDILYLKKFSALPYLLSKPNLRKNIFKIIKLILIYKKYARLKQKFNVKKN